MKVTADINIDLLLPLLVRYREYHWKNRAHELEGYLLDDDLKNREASDDEIDAAFDEHHAKLGRDFYYEYQNVKYELLKLLGGELPKEVADLQQQVTDRFGEE